MSTPHQGGPAGRPRGLSEQLRDLERSSAPPLLPDFDLDAAVRGGRRRARRRTAASVAATAAAVAAVVTAVALSPFGAQHTDPGPADPGPTATASTPAPSPATPAPSSSTPPPSASPSSAAATADVPPDGNTDTGRITALAPATAGGTVTYDRFHCDAAYDARVQNDPSDVGQVVCLLPPTTVNGLQRDGTDTSTLHQQVLAPDVVVTASANLARFLGKPEVTADGAGWTAQLPIARRVPVADLQRFLSSASAATTLFRFQFDAQGRVVEIDEVNNKGGV